MKTYEATEQEKTTREKLSELLKEISYDQKLGWYDLWDMRDGAEDIADLLITRGVTVQEWISVKDRLPENDYGKHWKERPHYLVCLGNGLMRVATFGFKEYGWWIDSHSCVLSEKHYTEVTHWMPLPQPPKGE